MQERARTARRFIVVQRLSPLGTAIAIPLAMIARWSFAPILAATVCMGCYDWVPTNVEYVRAHVDERFRVTDSVNQTVVADHVSVDGNDLVLVAAEQPIAHVDFVPKAPRLERRALDAGKTALLTTGIILGFAATIVGVALLATYDNGVRIMGGW